MDQINDRPELRRVLTDAGEGRCDGLVVYDEARLGRDPEELQRLRGLFAAAGVKVVSIGEETR